MADAGSPSPDPPPPLLQFHSLSAHSTRSVAQYWLRAPSPSLSAADTSKDAPSRTRRLVCHGPRGLPHHASHARPKARAVHSQSCARFRVWPPHHSHVVTLPRRSSTYGPPRVSSPTALSDGCVHSATAFTAATRVLPHPFVPPPGPFTLLTVYSATTPAGLFHPTRALGVPPFRAFSRRAGTPLDVRCPPDVSPIDPPRRSPRRPTAPDHGPIQRFLRAQRRKPTNVAFRALLPPEVRYIAAAV
jgi:hypothetical protein